MRVSPGRGVHPIWALVLLVGTVLLGACEQRTSPTPPPPILRVGYYVAPGGTAEGDGTWQRPWDLATALAGAGGRIQPGDTIWVRGGHYVGPFQSRLTGSPSAPIIVRQYPGERATLVNPSLTLVALHVTGQWAWYWGLEVTNSNVDRNTARPNGVYPSNANNRFINLVVHDNAVGISISNESPGTEVYGCIVYNNGYSDATRTHGHGIYTKNDGRFQKIIRDNIVFDQFRNGIQIFTDSGSGQLKNFLLEGNVWFNNGTLTSTHPADGNILVGGWEVADDIDIRDDMAYVSPSIDARNVRVGYANTLQNGAVALQGAYLAGGDPVLTVGYWTQATVSDNLLFGTKTILALRNPARTGQVWSGNVYQRDPAAAAWRYADTAYTFAGWQQATGFGTTDRAEADPPSTPQVFVRPNAYEPGRATIIVFNWSRQGTVAVDVSGVLQAGDRFEVHNVQDFYGAAVLGGTYTGDPLTLPMAGVDPPRPLGGSPGTPPRTGPDFDVFVVTRLPT